MLSGAAFNAFLKTLEEPPTYAKFILATTEKHKILPTILSRCQIFDFKRITVEDITSHLQNIASKEGVTADEDALNVIAQKADGALRDALSIFDQMVSFSGNNITYHDVIENLNVLDCDYYFKMVDYILANDVNSILLLINDVISKGFDPQHFIQGMASHLRNLLLGKDPRVIGIMEVSGQLKSRYAQQASLCTNTFLLKALDVANECDLNFRNANNKRLHLEIAVLKMTMPMAVQQPVASQPVPPVMQQQTNQGVMQQQMRQSMMPPSYQQPVQQNAPQYSKPTQAPTYQPTQQPVQQMQQPDATPQPARVVGRMKKTGTLSINDSVEEQKTVEVREETRNNPFTVEMLAAAWKKFVDINKEKSPSFVAGIGKYQPTLEGNKIHYQIDNSLVARDMNNIGLLREHLIKELDNNCFELVYHIVEHPVDEIAYTDRSRFEKMAEANPNLLTLMKGLKLEIEV